MTPRARRADSTPDVLRPLRSRGWLTEARRKAIHLGFIVLPLLFLHPWLPWPRSHAEWRLALAVLAAGAIAVDLVRLHEHRVRNFFRTFFGELIREHERFNLLGSTYLLIAALLAIELFPRPMAAAAVGYTVLGDAVAAIVGKAYGRIHFFRRTIEGSVAGLLACLAWAAYVSTVTSLPWEVAVWGAVVASLVELLPIPLDDNLGITLFAGYAMKFLGSNP